MSRLPHCLTEISRLGYAILFVWVVAELTGFFHA
jgi:hypothetical protein